MAQSIGYPTDIVLLRLTPPAHVLFTMKPTDEYKRTYRHTVVEFLSCTRYRGTRGSLTPLYASQWARFCVHILGRQALQSNFQMFLEFFTISFYIQELALCWVSSVLNLSVINGWHILTKIDVSISRWTKCMDMATSQNLTMAFLSWVRLMSKSHKAPTWRLKLLSAGFCFLSKIPNDKHVMRHACHELA